MEIPVYIFTGFLESGKTTFITETLQNPDFSDGEKTLLLVCEDGFVEYDEVMLGELDVTVERIESEDALNSELLHALHALHQPSQVVIELNGMWDTTRVLALDAPKDWVNVQVLTTINAQTFSMYVANMRSYLYQQVLHSELVIFNRCQEDTKKSTLRGTIKAINPRTQIIYEMMDGSVNTLKDDELPFDTQSDYLDIADHDYGLFCNDALEHPSNYKGKTVRIKGKCIGTDKYFENAFILGRQAMVCCQDDTALIGMVCVTPLASKLIPDEWVIVEGKIEVQFDQEYNGDVPILMVTTLEITKPLEDEYVYFG